MTKTNGNYRIGLHLSPQFKIRYADDDSPGYQEKHGAVRRYRQKIAPLLIAAAERMPMHQRRWFRISEIADVCAQIPDSVQLDEGKRERAVELLRKAILMGEFEDTDGRSRVANLHPAFAAELRFARGSAAEPIYFRPCISHLWIKRADCEAWFRRNRIEFPKEWIRALAVTQTKRGAANTRQHKRPQRSLAEQTLREIYPDGLPSGQESDDSAIMYELKSFFRNKKWSHRPDDRTIKRLLEDLRPEKPAS